MERTAHPSIPAAGGAALGGAAPSTTSSSASSEPGGDEEWDDWAEEAEAGDGGDNNNDDAAASLFDPALILPSVPAALAHDASTHAFDLTALRRALDLGDHGTFQLINWVRAEVGAGRDPRPAVATAVESGGSGGSAAPWADARWLVPTLPDDALLFYDYDDDEDGIGDGPAAAPPPAADGDTTATALAAARAEVAALRSALAALAAASLPPDAAAALPPAVLAALEEAGWEGAETTATGDGGTTTPKPAKPHQPPPSTSTTTSTPPPAAHPGATNVDSVDRGYFGGYAGLGIHRTMLSDDARTATYRAALEENPSTIKGKVVLDVGCGTGVLSMFAARGGAAAVVGVEGAAPMAALARRIVAANGLSAQEAPPPPGAAPPPGTTPTPPGPVTIIHARVEDLIAAGPLPLPADVAAASSSPKKAVDVIVSEWMGYALFFECMLDSVLAARDAWLKPGGALLPDTAAVHIAGVSPAATDLAFWADVHGLDLTPAAEAVKEGRRGTGAVLEVRPHHVVTAPATVLSLDLLTARPGDAEFSTPFCVAAVAPAAAPEGDGAAAAATPPSSTVTVAAVALWFDTGFTSRVCPDSPQLLCTGPASPQTHWHQAVLELDAPVTLSVGGGGSGGDDATTSTTPTHLRGRLSMARGAEHRSVDISLECEACVGADGPGVEGTKSVRLYTFAMSD